MLANLQHISHSAKGGHFRFSLRVQQRYKILNSEPRTGNYKLLQIIIYFSPLNNITKGYLPFLLTNLYSKRNIHEEKQNISLADNICCLISLFSKYL
jgi:hypothetical protein